MKRPVTTVLLLLIVLACAAPPARSAVIPASSDISKPSQSTNYSVNVASITESVSLSAAAGPWLVNIINDSGGGIASGNNRTITEVLTNLGGITWNAWHEKVASRTTIFTANDTPGFLVRNGSITVQADYGAGFVTLAQGPDYTLNTTTYTGPGTAGPNAEIEAFDIVLAPARVIATGKVLRIQKDIYEVFGDANIWQQGEAAQFSEFPVPEPGAATLALLASIATGMTRPRRRRAGTRHL